MRGVTLNNLFLIILVFTLVTSPVTAFIGPDRVSTPSETPVSTPSAIETRPSEIAVQQNQTQEGPTNDPTEHPAIDDLLGRQASGGSSSPGIVTADAGSSNLTVKILTKPGEESSATSVVNQYGTVDERADSKFIATIPESSLTDIANATSVRHVQSPTSPVTLHTGGEDEINVDTVHGLDNGGFKGENATVAIIDTTGFARGTQVVYNGQVIEQRGTTTEDVSSHGTETAETVAEVAPKADLILVQVNNSLQLENQIDYLIENTDTDVISMSLGFPNGGPLDGTSDIDSDVTRFVDNGGVFVTSAGNQADQQNWDGDHADANGNSFVEVDNSGSETVDLGDPRRFSRVYLQWDNHDPDTFVRDYALQVVNGSGDVIREADDTRSIGGGFYNPSEEEIIIRPSDDDPQIRIRHDGGSSIGDGEITDAHLVLNTFSSGVEFTPHTTAESLIVPAANKKAITVGAYGPAAREGTPNNLETFLHEGRRSTVVSNRNLSPLTGRSLPPPPTLGTITGPRTPPHTSPG